MIIDLQKAVLGLMRNLKLMLTAWLSPIAVEIPLSL
jgi:hypothetical protein